MFLTVLNPQQKHGPTVAPPLGTLTKVQVRAAPTGVSNTSFTLAYTSNVTAGNTLILSVGCLAVTTVTGVSDNLNGAWSKLVNNTTSVAMGECGIWAFANSAAGACTVTITTNASSFVMFIISEYSGLLSTISTAGTGSAIGSGTAQSSGNVTTTLPALLIGSTWIATGTPNTTAGAGWTSIDGNPGTIISGIVESQGEGTTGVVAGTYAATTATDNTTPAWVTCFAAVR